MPDFFRVFSLGHVLRQDGPVKVFTRVKVFKGTADVDGESSVFAIKRVRKFMIKTSKREGLFREVRASSRYSRYRSLFVAVGVACRPQLAKGWTTRRVLHILRPGYFADLPHHKVTTNKEIVVS